MTDLPDKIAVWRFRPEKADEWVHGGWSEDHDHKTVEYTRSDIADAAEARGYERGLREAAEIVGMYDENSDCSYCTDVTAINEAVTALIPQKDNADD